MANETPQSGTAVAFALAKLAVAQFRARFPTEEQLDQRMRLLHDLFARVIAHAGFGVPALLTNQAGLDAFAYEAWAAYAKRHPAGQMNQPRREPIRKLAAYWARELAADRSTTVRDDHNESSFAITERVNDPFQLVPMELYVRWTAPASRPNAGTETEEPDDTWLAIGVRRADAPPRELPEDPRIVLNPFSPEELLRRNAQVLVTSFQAADRTSFEYQERGVRVHVASLRPRARRIAWSLLSMGVLALTGCGIEYQREVGSGRPVYYQIAHLLGANAYCDGPRRDHSAIVVNWGLNAPSGWFVRTYLLRNGKRFARVDGRDEYWDTKVEPGRTYSYGFELRDIFGRLLARDNNTVATDIARGCPDTDEAIPNPITPSPTEGTFDTPFAFTIRTPAVDGQPVSYAWGWKSRRMDDAGHIVAPPPRITREPSTVIVFDPCTCGTAGTTADGAKRWTCSVETTVTFANGDAVKYGSPWVTIVDPTNRQCRTFEDLARSDAVP